MLATQTTGDCKKRVCDGNGFTITQSDDADTPNDMNDCTTDTCAGGVPTFTNVPQGTACNQNAGKVCSSAGKCVECVVATDCASNVCNSLNECVSAQCSDHTKNGNETDVDCGGSCPKCGPLKQCAINADCFGGNCTANVCVATCTDQVQNGAETDVDCGGTCPKCLTGDKCSAASDCAGGYCVGNVCVDVLLISGVQTRGSNGGNDEFIELYNPMPIPVTFDASWKVLARSAVGFDTTTCQTAGLASRITGGGQVIPAHGHILFVNSSTPGYDGATSGDASYTTGIVDAASIVVQHNGVTRDAVCFYYDATTQNVISNCTGAAYICEGTPLMSPHNNTSSTNSDTSLARKPGGSAGNGQDTGNNSADFTTSTAAPRNLASAPTP